MQKVGSTHPGEAFSERGGDPAHAAERRDTPAQAALIIGVAALACFWFAIQLLPVPDHAYQFHLAQRVLEGARLYVDVAISDMHPPLFTWLAVTIEAAARGIGVRGLDLYPVAISVAAGASLFAAWRVGPRSPWLFAALLVALVGMAGPYFGQGEHIALVLALPYLFAAAATAHAARDRSAPARLGIALAAAIGLAMKPHFAAVWLGVELYLARQRGWRSLLRLECVTIGAAFALYVAATAIFTPEFFTLLPWLMRLYPRFAPRPLSGLLLDWRALLLLAAAGGALAFAPRERRQLAHVLAIAAVAMYLAMLLQLKGWGYHWYPVVALSLVMLGLAAERWAARVRLAAPAVALAAVALAAVQVQRTVELLASWPTMLPELLRAVDEHGGGRPVLALSQYLQAGFPLVSIADVRWASPYAHLWMVPALHYPNWYGGTSFEYEQTGDWRWLERQIFDRTWEAIERERPGLLIVEAPHQNTFDMRAYFETDPRFDRLFDSARVVSTAAYYVVYALPDDAAAAASGTAPATGAREPDEVDGARAAAPR